MPRPARRIAALVTAALALASAPLLAGGNPATVKGKITGWDKLLPPTYLEAAKADSHRFTWREPSPTVKQDFRRLSANPTRDVCVAAIGASGVAHSPQHVLVGGGRMTPSTVVVAPGSRLAFTNTDPFPHRLYEVGSAQWGANALPPGASPRDWTASAPGVHVVRDELFPSVVISIVVEPNAVEYAFPDRDGVFSMSLPTGEYTLKAYFDGKPTGKTFDGVRVGDKDVDLKDPLNVAN